MKKILYLLQSWSIGGIETAIYNIANKLKPHFDFHFIATENPDLHPRYNQIGKCLYLRKDPQIIEYLKQNQIDLVQWGNQDRYFNCAKQANVKIIVERIAGPRSLNTNHSGNTHVISSSYGILPQIQKLYKGPITVIHNGIDLTNQISHKRFFGVDDFVVCYPSARMGEGQQYDILIKAVLLAHSRNPNIKIILMGSKPKHAAYDDISKQLKQLAKPLGIDCVFTGAVLDSAPIICGSDLIVVPAKSHGVSNSLIESSAYKKPIIATNVGQNNEICIDGLNGYLIKVGDVIGLSELILKLSTNKGLCKKLGQEGYNIVEKSFNLEIQAKIYKDLYERLLNEN